MNDAIINLLAEIRRLENEVERRLEDRQRILNLKFASGRVIIENAVIERHRRLKTRLATFLLAAPLATILTAPVIYAMIAPLALLDLFLWVYQRLCFAAWGIGRVQRSDYVIMDRHRLAYLNGIQKLNCLYCGYANGVIAYAREIASRTEQYWCPIKHALRVPDRHNRYRDFLDYGDAEGFAEKSEQFRQQLKP